MRSANALEVGDAGMAPVLLAPEASADAGENTEKNATFLQGKAQKARGRTWCSGKQRFAKQRPVSAVLRSKTRVSGGGPGVAFGRGYVVCVCDVRCLVQSSGYRGDTHEIGMAAM